jgi:S-adenosylmethionine:tRNA ribosyltransferase-isomerase
LPLLHPEDALVASYSFQLDPARIAQEPPARRGDSRLMVIDRGDDRVRHLRFSDLPGVLDPSDLLILNDTRVLPARLTGRKPTGGLVEILLLEPLSGGAWTALVRPSSRVKPGTVVTLERRGGGETGPSVVVGVPVGEGTRRIDGVDRDVCLTWGEMPLPPYIDRSDGPRDADRSRYQTVYAEHEGSVAAPTAGLHFSSELLARLDERGVARAPVTLHVGLGTFQPLRGDRLDDAGLHAEPWRLPPATAEAIDARSGRLVAVGTTGCRVLESWHRAGRPTDGVSRSTDLFLHPGDPPTLPMSLLTNFHLPGSSLVTLVAAFLGRQRTLDLYRQAIDLDYRFYSYGDAMLIL